VGVLARYGAPPVPSQLPLVRRVITDLFAGAQAARAPDASVIEARDMLYRLAAAMRKGGGAGDALPDLERLLLAAHYAAMRVRLAELALPELGAKAALSLLRYVVAAGGGKGGGVGGPFQADRAYYEAGAACRSVGWKAMALVLFNRFIDICDASEDGAADGAGLENGDFVGAGLPAPGDMLLPGPSSLFLAPKQREEVKDWVLAISMDRKVEQALAQRPCFACGAQIFEGALACPGCRAQFPSCVVTGYPIPASQLATCQGCGSKALKPAWNAVVGKTKSCPWCGVGCGTAL
jgi:intraflagellar transport protein 172